MLKTLLFALTVYCLVVAALFVWQRRILYLPGGTTPPPAEVGVPSMQEIGISGQDGLTLTSWYAPPSPDKPIVLYFQGNSGNIAGRAFKARDLIEWGYGVLLLGYPGYGGNPGSPSEVGLYSAARDAVSWLENRGFHKENIVLHGESLGTGVAVELASKDRFGAVVLEAPYTSITDIAAASYWYVPVRLLLKDRFESLYKIGDLKAPLLVLHGRNDGVIPFGHGEQIFDAAPEPKMMKTYDDGTHSDLYDHGALRDMREFLNQYPG